MMLTLEPDVKHSIEKYAEYLNSETGSDWSASEAAVIILRLWLKQEGLLEGGDM